MAPTLGSIAKKTFRQGSICEFLSWEGPKSKKKKKAAARAPRFGLGGRGSAHSQAINDPLLLQQQQRAASLQISSPRSPPRTLLRPAAPSDACPPRRMRRRCVGHARPWRQGHGLRARALGLPPSLPAGSLTLVLSPRIQCVMPRAAFKAVPPRARL